jgi:hypothetical protein
MCARMCECVCLRLCVRVCARVFVCVFKHLCVRACAHARVYLSLPLCVRPFRVAFELTCARAFACSPRGCPRVRARYPRAVARLQRHRRRRRSRARARTRRAGMRRPGRAAPSHDCSAHDIRRCSRTWRSCRCGEMRSRTAAHRRFGCSSKVAALRTHVATLRPHVANTAHSRCNRLHCAAASAGQRYSAVPARAAARTARHVPRSHRIRHGVRCLSSAAWRRCPLSVAFCPLHVVRCLLHFFRCTLSVHLDRCTLSVVRCPLHGVRCLLRAAWQEVLERGACARCGSDRTG